MKHKKLFAILTLVCFMFTLMPVAAFAGETAPAVELPTATVTELDINAIKEKENGTEVLFALNFKADEVTTEQFTHYKTWYADFELTVNKDVTFDNDAATSDGYLSGSYVEFQNGIWLDVPFEPVTVEATKSFRIMDYAAKNLHPGLKITYNEVCVFEKGFDCGVYFTQKF